MGAVPPGGGGQWGWVAMGVSRPVAAMPGRPALLLGRSGLKRGCWVGPGDGDGSFAACGRDAGLKTGAPRSYPKFPV